MWNRRTGRVYLKTNEFNACGSDMRQASVQICLGLRCFEPTGFVCNAKRVGFMELT